MPHDPSRARFLRALAAGAAGLAVAPLAVSQTGHQPMTTRRIPSSGAALPVIGCGTYIGFDVAEGGPDSARLPGVLQALFAAGGTVLDSSPMYGRSEEVTGRLLAASPDAPKAFVATKVWTSGREAGIRQMEESLRLLGRVDLMQIHNLLDWRTHLPVLRRWKSEGRIRYLGVTHYTSSAYRDLEAVMKAETLDFVQINYALDDRDTEARILPLAADRGMAVIVNRPFGGGGLLRRVSSRPLPAWAAEAGATSWAQLLLKFVLAHPAVTCAIPGTSRPEHMADNAAAGRGVVPDPAFWKNRIDSLLS